ncbi:MAG: hypothetical protein NWE98_00040 [Candidatus Bathyarchaeota archaeon]|nr:hypothetical protein [Candidatus Bathyarchaeota archaeon]
MPKKLSLEISDETYENLCKLADNFGLDYKTISNCILETVSAREYDITQLREMPGAEDNLRSILNEALETYPNFAYRVRELLTKLKAKGLFSIDPANVEWDIEEDFFSVIFSPESSADYDFDMINVRKEKDGRYNLGTYTYVEIEETKDNSFGELVKASKSTDCPFYVDEYSIDAYDNEEFCTLSIEYWAESLEDLPSLKKADRFIKQILKRANVTLKK